MSFNAAIPLSLGDALFTAFVSTDLATYQLPFQSTDDTACCCAINTAITTAIIVTNESTDFQTNIATFFIAHITTHEAAKLSAILPSVATAFSSTFKFS